MTYDIFISLTRIVSHHPLSHLFSKTVQTLPFPIKKVFILLHPQEYLFNTKRSGPFVFLYQLSRDITKGFKEFMLPSSTERSHGFCHFPCMI